jgi:hypothetical protein
MDTQLWKVRLTAFGYQALSLIIVAVMGVLVSEDFKGLVVQNFGDTFITSAVLLIINGVVAHIRNIRMLGKLGGSEDKRFLI